MKHKRIALLSATLAGGGAERVMVTLANSLSRSGYNVEVVLVQAIGCYLSELDDSIKIVDLKASRTFFALPALVKYLRRVQPDVLLSTQGHVNALAIFSRVFIAKKFTLIAREANTHSVSASDNSSFKYKVSNYVVSKLYKYADKIVAPSEGVRDDLLNSMSINASKLIVIPNPLDIEKMNLLSSEEVEVPFDCKVFPMILSVGRLTSQKNFSLLIKSFASVSQSTTAKLVILGEGEERQSLETLISSLGLQDRVYLLGFVENPYAYMKKAKLYVLSSIYEGLPNALLQAVALGTPVVANNCPSGPSEILDQGRWGCLLDDADVSSMGSAIQKGLQGDISVVPGSIVNMRYSMESVLAIYLKIFFNSKCE